MIDLRQTFIYAKWQQVTLQSTLSPAGNIAMDLSWIGETLVRRYKQTQAHHADSANISPNSFSFTANGRALVDDSANRVCLVVTLHIREIFLNESAHSRLREEQIRAR